MAGINVEHATTSHHPGCVHLCYAPVNDIDQEE
jgi:hypothetical protein